MEEQVLLRPFKPTDLEGIITLFKKVFYSHRSYEDERKLWEWKFSKNPYCMNNYAYAYVLEHDGRIVGNVEQIPIPVKIGEKTVTGLFGSDLCVEKKFRTYGLLLSNKFWNNKDAELLIGTSVIREVSPILKQFGAKELLLGNTFWFRVKHPLKILKFFLTQKNKTIYEVSDKNPLLSVIFASKNLLPGLKNIKTKKILNIFEVNRFGEDFDKLWEEISPYYGVTVMRNSKYLNWRYADFPLSKPKVFAARNNEGKLKGFAAVTVTKRDSLRIAHIIELFTKPDDTCTQQELLNTIMNYSACKKVDFVAASVFSSQMYDLLAKNLFIKTEVPFSRYLYKYNGPHPILLEDERNWYVSPSDGDVAL